MPTRGVCVCAKKAVQLAEQRAKTAAGLAAQVRSLEAKCATAQHEVQNVKRTDILRADPGSMSDAQLAKVARLLPAQQTAVIRETMRRQVQVEFEAKFKAREKEAQADCSVCLERKADHASACGHVLCQTCWEKLDKCPTCRAGKRDVTQLFLPST
jgi:hypothetical protein